MNLVQGPVLEDRSFPLHASRVVTPAHRIQYTLEDYLALERVSTVKHEYLDGQIYGMAGGTPEHAALKAAITGLLFGQLRGGTCRLHDSDLRVRVEDTGLYTYPDVTVVCGRVVRDPNDANAVINPRLIVEVTSPSTDAYDRGDKFEHYQRIPSLMEYVLVAHESRRVDVGRRGDDGRWSVTSATGQETVELGSVGASFGVDELYEAAGV